MNEGTSEIMVEEWLPEGDRLVFFNEKNYKSWLSHFESRCEAIEKCIADFNSLDIGTFEQKDLYLLFESPESYVSAKRVLKLGNAPVIVHGVSLNKIKLLEMMDMPNGYALFLKQVYLVNSQIARYFNRNSYNFIATTLREYLGFFTFNDEGKIIITESVEEEIKKLSTRSVHSDK